VPKGVSLRYKKAVELQTSGKSTQKAFMFIPYKKLAKLSLNRDRLSCINCRCIKFASRSAIESDSSAKAGSRDSRGNSKEMPPAVKPWPSRNDVRELERRGVVGRDERLLRVCEVERRLPLPSMATVCCMLTPDSLKSESHWVVLMLLAYCWIFKTNTKQRLHDPWYR